MTISEANRNLFREQLPEAKFETLETYWNHLSDEHEYAADDYPCFQRLTITSEAGKDLEAVSMAMLSPETGDLTFSGVTSAPDDVLLSDERNGVADLWFYLNWGTRFQPEITGYTVTDDAIDVSFTTALLPADTWVKYLAARFPQLRFALLYAEPETDTSGRLECFGGKVISETIDDGDEDAS